MNFTQRLSPTILLGVVICLLSGCKRESVNWSTLIEKYSKKGDSLYLKSVLYLRENNRDLTSEKITFIDNATGRERDIRLDTIANDSILDAMLTNMDLDYKREEVSDLQIFSTDYIDRHIEQAVGMWRRYPWTKDKPDSLFLNYLLPYKVLREAPSKNIDFFIEQYRTVIDSMAYEKANTDVVYWKLNREVGKWFSFSGDDHTILSHSPSLDELLCIKKGACYHYAILYAYMLKSAGIPATVALVPKWGSKNGDHAEVLFMDSTGKMVTPERNRLANASKIFWMTFKNQRIWSTEIKPLVGGYNFAIPYLKNDHWIDATTQHRETVNIPFSLPGDIKVPFAYICVYNYGRWTPVFWGKVEADNKGIFKNMGVDMLYSVGIPDIQDGYRLIGKTFLVDTSGNVHIVAPSSGFYAIMCLDKVNTGARSSVAKGESYTLEYYDVNGKWEKLATKKCESTGVIEFQHVPANTIYRLINEVGDGRLERPFTYDNEKPYWR
ncbi:hypothetical protein FHW36_111126 [Chitinophaga polysaccharea]|uniref:Transglutaminase-like domain-containing protein n=1 Tax=Chitinophaga polysaccharea TaxID=1293035 RepID=A0A561P743_9BACT|nr:transglutaminase domain-containing protein [Chitinophaga polysaccharea]TWF33935.1 hypothetical protein FHW36_111126 [Chitinophaga polysaccharea]